MHIGGLEKSSLIDYPGKIAAVVFTHGCNFRCDYCHNPELVYPTMFGPELPEPEVLAFLEKRRGKLDGVVITGGEPTMQADLAVFMRKVKALGFLIKLDTNGSLPEVLAPILKEGLADYVAMDIKGPLEKYQGIACVALNPEKVEKSIGLIIGSAKKFGLNYEFRTTVVKSQIAKSDFPKIGEMIRGAQLYALQKFLIPPAYKIVNQAFLSGKTYSDSEFEAIREKMERYVGKCVVR